MQSIIHTTHQQKEQEYGRTGGREFTSFTAESASRQWQVPCCSKVGVAHRQPQLRLRPGRALLVPVRPRGATDRQGPGAAVREGTELSGILHRDGDQHAARRRTHGSPAAPAEQGPGPLGGVACAARAGARQPTRRRVHDGGTNCLRRWQLRDRIVPARDRPAYLGRAGRRRGPPVGTQQPFPLVPGRDAPQQLQCLSTRRYHPQGRAHRQAQESGSLGFPARSFGGRDIRQPGAFRLDGQTTLLIRSSYCAVNDTNRAPLRRGPLPFYRPSIEA